MRRLVRTAAPRLVRRQGNVRQRHFNSLPRRFIEVSLLTVQRFSTTFIAPPSSASAALPSPLPTALNLAAKGVSIAALRAAFEASKESAGNTNHVDAAQTSTAAASMTTNKATVTVRARVERTRGRGKLAFVHLRQPPLDSLQAVCVGKELATQAKQLSPESIVDVTGTIQPATTPVQSTTCQDFELLVTAIQVVSAAATPLPFPYHDANTKLDTRLKHRIMDLRTERMVAIARLVSAIGQRFRDELLARQFIEIHTPKLIAAASEGGSNVFTVDYFGAPAYLAQSPQLYKQMMLMGDAMRVFEVGPVFRAENSLTHRHLTEFVGLDGELVIRESYTEVLDVLEPVMCAILQTLTQEHAPLMDVVWRQRATLSGHDRQGLSSTASSPSASDPSADEISAVSRPGHGQRLRNVRCEVPVEAMASLGITYDVEPPSQAVPFDAAPPTPAPAPAGAESPSSAQRDLYHARVGGVSGRCVLRLAFADAVRLLVDHGGAAAMAGSTLPLTDFSLPQERRLGDLIRARYGVDLYVVDQFPAAARPFYTMPTDVSNLAGPTRSYDMYLRGEEICSGAQRVHDVALLEQRLQAKGVDPASVKDYVDSFRYGAWPHGGFGLGLERIALFCLDLEDIRQVSLFPRDPKRLTP